MAFQWEILLTLLLSLLFFLNIAFHLKHKKNSTQTAPGPQGLPFIGNLFQFNNAKPHEFLLQLSNKYGPLMSLKLGFRRALVISSAKMAKEALKTNDVVFSSRPTMTGQQKLSYNGRDVAFSAYNSYWKEMRKICVIHLLSNKRIQSFHPLLEHEVSKLIEKIKGISSLGQHININEISMSFSSSVICRVAFGKSYSEDGHEKKRFKEVIEESQAMLAGFFFSDYFPWLGWVDKLNGMVSRLDRNFNQLDSFFQELLDEHLDPNRPPRTIMNDDIIDLLIQLKEDETSQFDITWDHIKAILMDIFVAATDTIGASIIWSMTALMKNNSILKRVQAEIRGIVGKKGVVNSEDLIKFPYLKAIVKEALRLYPPSPIPAPRETTATCFIEGYKIEPKTTVYFNMWAIARDPESWDKPNEFNPERFLDTNIDVRGHDYEVLPFGAGRRGCPGISLGLATVELALANLLCCFDWELPSGTKSEDIDTDVMPGLTMHKKTPLWLLSKKCES